MSGHCAAALHHVRTCGFQNWCGAHNFRIAYEAGKQSILPSLYIYIYIQVNGRLLKYASQCRCNESTTVSSDDQSKNLSSRVMSITCHVQGIIFADASGRRFRLVPACAPRGFA